MFDAQRECIREKKNGTTKTTKRSPLNGTETDMDDKCPRK